MKVNNEEIFVADIEGLVLINDTERKLIRLLGYEFEMDDMIEYTKLQNIIGITRNIFYLSMV